MSRALAAVATVAALAAGFAVGWTAHLWQPSPDLVPAPVHAPVEGHAMAAAGGPR